MSHRIGIDIDGILASWDDHFHQLLETQCGRELPHPGEPEVWDWPSMVCKCSKKELQKAYDFITENPAWWIQLPVKDMEALEMLRILSYDSHYNFYFITSRHPDRAKFWTEVWLNNHGIPTPTVLLSNDKGFIAKGLNLTAFVDDNELNVVDVRQQSPKTRSYLVSRPFNKWANAPGMSIKRVNSLAEMLRMEIELAKEVKK